MFGKINFDKEIHALNKEMLSWVEARKIGKIFLLPKAPLLLAKVKRSLQTEFEEFMQLEILRKHEWLGLAKRLLDSGSIDTDFISATAEAFSSANGQSNPDDPIFAGCRWGLALALSETERIGEEPPVARLCMLSAYNHLEIPFDSDEEKNSFSRLSNGPS